MQPKREIALSHGAFNFFLLVPECRIAFYFIHLKILLFKMKIHLKEDKDAVR